VGQAIDAVESERAGSAVMRALVVAAHARGRSVVEPPPGGEIWISAGAVEFETSHFSVAVEGRSVEVAGNVEAALAWLASAANIALDVG